MDLRSDICRVDQRSQLAMSYARPFRHEEAHVLSAMLVAVFSPCPASLKLEIRRICLVLTSCKSSQRWKQAHYRLPLLRPYTLHNNPRLQEVMRLFQSLNNQRDLKNSDFTDFWNVVEEREPVSREALENPEARATNSRDNEGERILSRKERLLLGITQSVLLAELYFYRDHYPQGKSGIIHFVGWQDTAMRNLKTLRVVIET